MYGKHASLFQLPVLEIEQINDYESEEGESVYVSSTANRLRAQT